MSTTVQVSISIEVKQRTPKHVQQGICKQLRDNFVPVKDFSKGNLSFTGDINYSYCNLSGLEGLKFPVAYNKYIIDADMRITHWEQAPVQDYCLVEED